MKDLGIQGKLGRWIHSFLDDRDWFVVIIILPLWKTTFIITILELLNATSMMNITQLLHIYFCTNWSCSVFDQTVDGGSFSTPMLSAHASSHYNRTKSKPWNLWGKQSVSSWCLNDGAYDLYKDALLVGEGLSQGGLPFPETGCPVPDVGYIYLICNY